MSDRDRTHLTSSVSLCNGISQAVLYDTNKQHCSMSDRSSFDSSGASGGHVKTGRPASDIHALDLFITTQPTDGVCRELRSELI